jgi:hypothetical protein
LGELVANAGWPKLAQLAELAQLAQLVEIGFE